MIPKLRHLPQRPQTLLPNPLPWLPHPFQENDLPIIARSHRTWRQLPTSGRYSSTDHLADPRTKAILVSSAARSALKRSRRSFCLNGWLQLRWRVLSRLRRYKEDLSTIWAARFGTGRKTAHVDDSARKRAKHLLPFLAFDPQRHGGRLLLGSRRCG